jgi:membrane-anchored glycerophosphoryl diester phosphodiesterase (GDPDase)
MENENQIETHDYDFDIIEIIKAGWARMEGVKAQLFAGFAIYVVVAIVVQLTLGLVFPQGTNIEPHYLNQQIVGILSYPVLMPIMAGIIMMAINHGRGEQIDFKSVFNYYHLTGKLALAGILIYIMTMIGFVLLVLPAIYLSVAYAFALPLIVDKNMDVWAAMEHSRKTVTKHWFKVAGLMGLLSIILFLGAIPLGIGLIWTVPLMFVTMYGLAYPVMFE